MKLKPLALAITMATAPFVSAETQWVNDPITYLTATEYGDANQSVIDSQGNIITGYSLPSEGYDLVLSKFDRNGNKLWGGNESLVKDRNTSFILTWDLKIGKEDAIYTAFDDVYASETYLSKHDADGALEWQLASPATEEFYYRSNLSQISPSAHGAVFTHMYQLDRFSSKLAVGIIRDDGYMGPEVADPVVNSEDDAVVEPIHGEALWVASFSEEEREYTPIDVIALEDGFVVLTMSRRDSDNANALFAQKFNYDGEPQWGENPKLLMDDHNALPNSGVPSITLYDDGNGGVSFTFRIASDFTGDLYFQNINADGKRLFASTGIRVSSNMDSEFADVSNPTIVHHNNEFIIGWTAAGGQGPYYRYAGAFQRVKRDGTLVFDNPVLVADNYTLEPDENGDYGVIGGGYLSAYGSQLSLAYALSDDYTQLDAEIRRVDFDLDGNIIRDFSVADPSLWVSRVSPGVSPWGDWITSFKAGLDTGDSDVADKVFLQSVQANGDIGSVQTLALSWPTAPYFVKEDHTFITDISFIDEQVAEATQYDVKVESASEEATVTHELMGNTIKVTITPAAEFAGSVPFSVSVTSGDDAMNTASMDYLLTVNGEDDAPMVEVVESAEFGEDEMVEIAASVMDVDSDNLSIEWQQTSGEPVSFDPYAATLAFHTPVVQEDENLGFSLTVADETTTVSKDVSVVVKNDKTPTINANGISLTEGTYGTITATFSGAKDPVSFSWTQVSGPALALDNTDTSSVKVSAPYVSEDTTATLQLTIVDGFGETASKEVTVTIENEKKSDGGSTSWWLLGMLAASTMFRRFFGKANV